MADFLVMFLIAFAMNVAAYLLMPKPKQPKPAEAEDAEDPTAEAGRPLPVVFGTIEVRGLNVLDYTDKSKNSYEIKV